MSFVFRGPSVVDELGMGRGRGGRGEDKACMTKHLLSLKTKTRYRI